jgi:hypothetical protein
MLSGEDAAATLQSSITLIEKRPSFGKCLLHIIDDDSDSGDVEATVRHAKARGGIIDVLRTAQRSLTSSELQWRAFEAISDKTMSNYEREKCIGVALPTIFESMQVHRSDPQVQEWGCRAIQNLGVHDGNRLRIGESGAVHAIVDGVRSCPDAPMVTARAAQALEILCLKCDENKVVLASYGVIQLALAALAKFHKQGSVVQACTRLLATLALNDKNRHEMEQKGAAALVVSTMKVHKQKLAVQIDACRFLSNLCSSCSGPIKLRMMREGGLEMMLESLARYHSTPALVEWACRALADVCNDDKAKVAVTQSDAFDVVLDAVREVTGSERAFGWSLLLASRLCISPELKDRAGASGLVALILAALVQHKESAIVTEMCFRSLNEICKGSVVSRRLVGDKGVAFLLRWLHNRNQNPQREDGKLCLWALRVLNTLGMFDETKEALAQHGGLQIISRTMQCHKTAKAIRKVGEETLEQLTCFKLSAGGTKQAMSTPTLPLLTKLVRSNNS